MEQTFIQLALVLLIAFVVSYIVSLFKQPLVIGYILAGIVSVFIIESGFAHLSASTETIQLFSQFGIAFLLFIVGIHLNPKVIKEIGASSLLIGLGQMALTFIAGFVISFWLLGFNTITSAYIAIALAFSSTIIIMKLLSDKRQLDSLHGKISIGILIIQDIVAIAVLMFISSMGSKIDIGSFAIRGVLGGGVLIFILFLFGYFALPKFIDTVAKSQELLFLFSIFWCFLIAALFDYLGFSIEIGALVAGVILSISPYSTEISSKVRPLRDFFLIIFFIILGFNIQLSNIKGVLFNALILSSIALILKPIILMALMRFAGYTKRNNFLVGTTLAQISEFSLIILTLGVSLGHISKEILSTLTLTGIITITISSYMIIYSNKFYNKISNMISFFEKKSIRERRKKDKKYDAVLFGYNRIGFSILRSLRKIKKKYLVVDFNPEVISTLLKFRIPCLYGDVYDAELLQELPLNKIKLAISTIPDFETNFLLIEAIRIVNPNAVIIARAHHIKDALELYKKGANYVLTPHFLGGEYVAKMIEEDKMNDKKYDEEKKKHIKTLIEMSNRGHKHPDVVD